MKIVIQTQILENYAAHDENYSHGVDESYWKAKGGNTYVVEGVSIEDAQSEGYYDTIFDLITENNEFFQEYILGSDLIDDVDFVESDHKQPWESITYITQEGEQFHATKTVENGEYGYMRKEIAKVVESYVMKDRDFDGANSFFENGTFRKQFHLVDGTVCNNSSEFLNMISEAA